MDKVWVIIKKTIFFTGIFILPIVGVGYLVVGVFGEGLTIGIVIALILLTIYYAILSDLLNKLPDDFIDKK